MRLFCSFLLALSALAAESADWIWTGRYVVTMDAQRHVIRNGAIAIRGDRILAAGPESDIERRFQAPRHLDRPDAIVAPGLISTHTHAAMSLLRGVAGDVRLEDWLEHYIFPAEARNVTPDFVRWGTRLACLEMLLSGTTTFTDMYYFEDVVAEAAKEAGMRGVLGETIIGFKSPDAKTPQDALAFTERFLTRFHDDPLIVPAVAPHAIYTNSDQTLKACRALANRHGAPLLIHLSETKRENEECLAKRKMTPTQALDGLGVFNGRTLAAHAVWVDDADLKILQARGVGIAHCPSSNMMLASGVAPVTHMLALGLNVGLGPDGPAGSNNDFNMFEEMDLAAKLQKVTTGDPRSVPAITAFEMATIRGARALGMEKEIGSLEPGKRADLISIRLNRPNAVPLYNVYSQLVYSLKGCDVEDVMVNGKLLVKDAHPLTLNAAEIEEKARQYGEQVEKSLR
jgi:5-methylthioadenosine/S-adenosylhomocysteine deaminase